MYTALGPNVLVPCYCSHVLPLELTASSVVLYAGGCFDYDGHALIG